MRIEATAARSLASRVGNQTSTAGMEFEKLATAAEPSSTLPTAGMVSKLVRDHLEFSIPSGRCYRGCRVSLFSCWSDELQQETGSSTAVSLPLIRLLARHFRILLQMQLSEAPG